MKAVIVDDEPHARELIREYLDAHSDISLLGECANGFDAVKIITESRPDVVFLDVQMPKLDGFEVVELLDEVPAIIFVTAHDEYAIRAFDVSAVDYLMKPVSRERFDEALDKARARTPAAAGAAARRAAGVAKPLPATRIVAREGSKIEVFPASRIDYIEADDDYVRIVSGERSARKQERLSELESQLDPARFIRIHRSTIVNIDRVARVEPYSRGSRVAVLHDGTKLPVSRSGWSRLKELGM